MKNIIMHLQSGSGAKLAGFLAIMFVVYFADAVMSYSVPDTLEETLNSPALMGLVVGSSSLVGIVADFAIGGWLRGKRSRFFTIWAVGMAVLFPLSFVLLPASLPAFILAMAIWGIYYELVQFSNYHFIEEHTNLSQHAFAWGALSTFKAAAYTFGPLVAGLAGSQLANLPFYISLGLSSFALIAVIGYMSIAHRTRNLAKTEDYPHRTLSSELQLWKLLGSRVWHLLAFVFAMFLVDSTFWTVGVLLSEEIGHGEQGLVLVAYGLPSLVIGMFAAAAAKPFGKKRAAFISAIGAGVFLTALAFVTNDIAILGLVFAASCFLAIAWPEIYAVFEDYVSRLGKTGNDFIGLQSSVGSLSYIFGPIIAGGLASVIGNRPTIAVVGFILAAVAVTALVIVPRKIKMPQKQLKGLVEA